MHLLFQRIFYFFLFFILLHFFVSFTVALLLVFEFAVYPQPNIFEFFLIIMLLCIWQYSVCYNYIFLSFYFNTWSICCHLIFSTENILHTKLFLFIFLYVCVAHTLCMLQYKYSLYFVIYICHRLRIDDRRLVTIYPSLT